jgi:hypothetical protein
VDDAECQSAATPIIPIISNHHACNKTPYQHWTHCLSLNGSASAAISLRALLIWASECLLLLNFLSHCHWHGRPPHAQCFSCLKQTMKQMEQHCFCLALWQAGIEASCNAKVRSCGRGGSESEQWLAHPSAELALAG